MTNIEQPENPKPEQSPGNEAARELSKLGASKGGKARAESLTSEERREIARKAVNARWQRVGKGKDLPKATHAGVLQIGDVAFDCAVLDNGTRVISETKFMEAMGMYRSGALSSRRVAGIDGAQPPLFLAYKNLKPFTEKHLSGVHDELVDYRAPNGSLGRGIKAELLPKICEVWLDAKAAGKLGIRQTLIAAKADILLRGLAHVGIIALVDEATGYQSDRVRDALAKILEAFVAKELRKWVRTFEADFYKELFRLRGIPYTGSIKRPAYIGHLTNDLVYSRLAPGVLHELRTLNPPNEKGRRKAKHFQWLTQDVGHPKLQQHLASVTALMRASDNWDQFKKMLDRALPVYLMLPLFKGTEDEAIVPVAS